MNIVSEYLETQEQVAKNSSEIASLEQEIPEVVQLRQTIADAKAMLKTANDALKAQLGDLKVSSRDYDTLVTERAELKKQLEKRKEGVESLVLTERLDGANASNMTFMFDDGVTAIIPQSAITGWSVRNISQAVMLNGWLKRRGMEGMVTFEVKARATLDAGELREYLWYSELFSDDGPPVQWKIALKGAITVQDSGSDE